MKILVTGNAGSGKSTFGNQLAIKHNIPLYGLDKIVWQESWIPTPRSERLKHVKAITDKETWIIEGVSKAALSAADKVYFLDIPTYRCIFNIIIRFVKNGPASRQELPDNCPEYIGFLKAIKVAWIFRKQTRPWIIKESHHQKFVHIRNYKKLKELSV
ncbi:MAG: hypothetical protein HON90_07235 [Halobacteriovoraceae bacterium]|jgi:adenylate kinase family enzyme|nr:hypothetical protein [Halobacteriovoraceae bacterium]